MSLPDFFDLDDRLHKLNERDTLISLNELIDWESFRGKLNEARVMQRKSKAGRKPSDNVLMFKSLVLQQLYNLSDDELEYQIRDRYSFCRFSGLSPEGNIPDTKTIWLFREQLTRNNIIGDLFFQFQCQ